jgi:hypothetical protein
MLSVGTTASAGLKDWVHSFYSNLNVLESGLANQNYDSRGQNNEQSKSLLRPKLFIPTVPV